MITQLNISILSLFNTSNSPSAVVLRANSNGLFADIAPPGTDLPYILYRNLISSNSQTMCSNIFNAPVDFEVRANTAAESQLLGYHIRQLYANYLLDMESPYNNVSSLYNTTYTTYDSINSEYVTIVSFNFYVSEPQNYIIDPVNPGLVESIFSTVSSLSGDWNAARIVNIDFGFAGQPYYDVPEGGAPFAVGTYNSVDNIRIESGIATCLTPPGTQSTMRIDKNSITVGSIVFDVGQNVGVVVVDTTLEAGDILQVIFENVDTAFAGISINLLGARFAQI